MNTTNWPPSPINNIIIYRLSSSHFYHHLLIIISFIFHIFLQNSYNFNSSLSMEHFGTNNLLCDVIEEKIDWFDNLPDPIIVMIFDKIYDAKSLCRCLVVSKRFASLVSEIGSVCISMNRSKLKKPIEDWSKSRNGSKSFFKNFVSKFVTKPLNFLQQVMLSNNKKMLSSSSSSNSFGSGVDIFKWVDEILRNFIRVESVSVELPCHGGEIGMNKNIPLLKWEASFGEVMDGCVIIGANSVSLSKNGGNSRRNGMKFGSCGEGSNENDDDNDEDEEDDHVFSDEELRLRIIWIISCLIASSGRHNLVKKMVGQCSNLKNVVISDAGKQGKLHMNEAQLMELRNSMRIGSTTHTVNQPPGAPGGAMTTTSTTTSTSTQVGYVGNLVMKLWYVKELELPNSGQVMKGATLVVIKPENKVVRGKVCDGVSLWGGFEGDKVFEEASKELLRRKEKRVYRLEVNSF